MHNLDVKELNLNADKRFSSSRGSAQATHLRVMIAGGGTGGHVYPGIAIAREIRKRHPEAEVLFVGTERGLENKIVPAEGFALGKIRVSGLKGIRGRSQLKSLWEIPRSLWDSGRIIWNFNPSVVVGVGGYSSGPPVLVAAILRIPTLLQEQNVHPGMTNRLLSRFARKVAVGFGECEKYFGKKTVITGNPVRSAFSKIRAKSNSEKFVILIFGGSQGAQAINTAVREALEKLRLNLFGLEFIHQTGERDYEATLEAYRKSGAVADVRPFFKDIPDQFAKADLLICRSGATTLAEIAVAGKAALLVPFPLATDNHQQKNAESLVQAGAAEMILQKNLNGEVLAARIQYYLQNREELRHMGQRSRGLGRSDSTERIVDLIEELARPRVQRMY